MEDRLTAGLWLETSDLAESDDRARRLDTVGGHPGVERASTWTNAQPGRDDLPRTLEEFSTLGLYEVSADFEPPEVPDGVQGFHFRRYPRPAQGRLTGRATIGLLVVLITPRAPDQAQALRDWGDFVHLRHIAEAAVPGYTMITPYELAGGTGPRYLHLYEMDTHDPEAAFQSMTPLVAERLGEGSDAFRQWAMTPELRIDYVNTFRRSDVEAPAS